MEVHKYQKLPKLNVYAGNKHVRIMTFRLNAKCVAMMFARQDGVGVLRVGQQDLDFCATNQYKNVLLQGSFQLSEISFMHNDQQERPGCISDVYDAEDDGSCVHNFEQGLFFQELFVHA